MSNDQRAGGRPRVSVCIALYNHAQYVAETIGSVLGQSYSDLEVVVVDDGSTDESLAVVTEIARGEPRVRVFAQEHRGISAAVNRAVLEARGELISFIASDDMLNPDTVLQQVARLDEDPEAGLVYGLVELVTRDGRPMDRTAGEDITKYPSQLEAIILGCKIPSTTIMVRRECFDRVGLLNEEVVYGDWEMSIRMLARYRAAFIDRPLAKYRIHDRNTSIGSGASPEKIRDDALAALSAVRRIEHEIPGDRAMISVALGRSFVNVQRRYARMVIDNFIATSSEAGARLDPASLRAAWKASPRDVYRSRKTPALARALLRRTFRRSTTSSLRGTPTVNGQELEIGD